MKIRSGNLKKRILSLLLCTSMVTGSLPAPTLATGTESDGLCDHHLAHTAECGYAAAVTGSDCTHQHEAGCVQVTDTGCVHVHGQDGCTYTPAQEAVSCGHVCSTDVCGCVPAVAESGSCNHVCSVESGCQTSILNCTHTEHTAECGLKHRWKVRFVCMH